MAERVSAKIKEVWDQDYGMLSEYGVHPRFNSIRELVIAEPGGQKLLRPGGYYDKVWVNFILYHTLRELEQVFATIAMVMRLANIAWATPISTLQKVDSLWRQIDEQTGEELGEPIESSEFSPFCEATNGETNS